MLYIGELQNLCQDKNDERIVMTKHARSRFRERSITLADIKNAIRTGKIIEQYENDKPFPSCLLSGITENNKYIHAVVSIDNEYLYVITAYYPDASEWESDLVTRKEH